MSVCQTTSLALAAGVSILNAGQLRRTDTMLRPLGLVLAAMATVALAAPAIADQHKIAADNARIDCTASKRDLTRISLVGDAFASVSKVSTGYPFSDFSVVNEPVRGDIYLSVPDTYAARSLSFFATSRKGYVYKFICQIAGAEAEQIFVTNPALASAKAREWEQETPLQEAAVRLLTALAAGESPPGYEVRHTAMSPVQVGQLTVRLIAQHRGAALVGKTLRIENRSASPVTIAERDIAPQGTLAVAIAEATLAPGHATAAYLVGQAGDR